MKYVQIIKYTQINLLIYNMDINVSKPKKTIEKYIIIIIFFLQLYPYICNSETVDLFKPRMNIIEALKTNF